MKRYFIIVVILSYGIYSTYGQGPRGELASFNYGLIPDLGDTQVTSYQVATNLGAKLKNGFLGIGFNYTHFDFAFNGNNNGLSLAGFEEMHQIQARLFYRSPLSKSWALNVGVTPSIQSNLKNGITSKDIIFGAIGTLTKSWVKEQRRSDLSFGVTFGTAFGSPRIFPVISYRSRINQHWSYSLGVPSTALNYQIDERHQIALQASFRGLFGNNSDATDFQDLGTIENTKLQFNALLLGLSHNYRIQPNWTTNISIGYSAISSLEIKDEDNNTLYDFEPNGSIYINMGIKFNLNKAIDENKKQ